MDIQVRRGAVLVIAVSRKGVTMKNRSTSAALIAAAIALASAVSDAHDTPRSPGTQEPPFKGVVVAPGDGRILKVFGETITVKASPADTRDGYAVVEETSPPGGGTPLHTHSNEDEVFYVLEGQLEFQRGHETLLAGPGTTAVLPRGIPHAFRNVGSAPSKVFVIMAPGRLLGFFEEVDRLSKQQEVTPADASRIGAPYKLTIHPPPPKQ